MTQVAIVVGSSAIGCSVEISRSVSQPGGAVSTFLNVYVETGELYRKVALCSSTEIHVAPCSCAIQGRGQGGGSNPNLDSFFNFSDAASPSSVCSASTAGTAVTARSFRGKQQDLMAQYSHRVTLLEDAAGMSEPAVLLFDSHDAMEDWLFRVRACRGPRVIPMSPCPLLSPARASASKHSGSLTPPRPKTFSFKDVLSPKRAPAITPKTDNNSKRQTTVSDFQARCLDSAVKKGKGGSPFSPSRKDWRNTAACELCKSPFALLHRRHHCRSCSRCICSDCSVKLYMPGVASDVLMCNR